MRKLIKVFGVSSMVFAFQVITQTSLVIATLFSSSAHAGSSSICVSKNDKYIIETSQGEDCAKLFFQSPTGYTTITFKSKSHTCENVGSWSTTHSFSRLSKSQSNYSICKGMGKARYSKTQYNRKLSGSYKQVIDNVYNRKEGREVDVRINCSGC